MVFRPLPLAAVEGLRAYPAPPVVRDHVERGDFTGERVERITYVCERPGRAAIPALHIFWWNVESKTLGTATLPAVAVRIGGLPALRGGWWLGLLACAAALVVAGAACWRRWRVRRASPEAECFVRLERACRAGDAAAAYNALLAWLDVTRGDGRVATIEDDLLARHADGDLRRHVTALEDAGLRRDVRWDGAPFGAALRRLRRAQRRRHLTAAPVLPALNPR
jgi:hypothetical protein